MKNLRRILVAIKSPAARAQPALRKAAQLAAATGAQLELFHALAEPVYFDAFGAEGLSLPQVQRRWRERADARLEKLAAPLRQEGLRVTVASDWDFPAYEAVIRHAQRSGADLIVAERHATRHLLPWLLRFNDWELLRRSALPVLLVKSARAWKRPAVLAAIDPLHSFAKPAGLETAILDAAALLASALRGRLDVAYAWPGAVMPVAPISPVPAALALTGGKQAQQDARRTFAETVQKSAAAKARRHFVPGQAIDVIPALAKKQRSGIAVMGAVSRSGLKRFFIGNIAEQVLDALQCDVLVMKPSGFKARVPAKKRGVQLIPTPPYI